VFFYEAGDLGRCHGRIGSPPRTSI
jgi:hypothetical protein